MTSGDVVRANERGIRERSIDARHRYRLIRPTNHRDMWIARDVDMPTLIVGLEERFFEVTN